MKKQSFTEIVLYLITGLLPLAAYYFLMTEFFKVNPFHGYYLIISIYLLICYFLYPLAGRKFSEYTSKKKTFNFIPSKTQLLIAFFFAPFVLLFKK